jgi:thiol-disulfide isomerase/thioredoxin
MLRRIAAVAAVALLAAGWFGRAQPASAQSAPTDPYLIDESTWYPTTADGSAHVALYFVYSETCPHCLAAKPFISYLADTYDWLELRAVSAQAATDAQIAEVVAVADSLGETIGGVPSFLYCEQLSTGFADADTTGAELERALVACHDAKNRGEEAALATADEEDLTLPVLGHIDAESLSLPFFTVAVAGLDAFNPCAFFVLLFLLSLLVHARSRWRMALVGGVFVVVSGVMYFAFMAAWLNVFLVTGQLRWVTALAGAIALVLAIFNVKDYFWPGRGGSLSIPDDAKPGLFARMRRLTTGDALPTVIVGTIALAAVANSYELLCTAGFPMVFTRVLTLNDLSTPTYYGYLGLYNVVYVIPLLAIVGVFVWTLGSRKLTEREGRFLKLVSGTMMLGLGGMLLLRPAWLENILAALSIMVAALAVAAVVSLVDRRRPGRA